MAVTLGTCAGIATVVGKTVFAVLLNADLLENLNILFLCYSRITLV